MFLWTCTQFWLLLPIYARYCLPLTCRSRNCEFAPMFQTMSFSLELGGSESNALVVWKWSVLVIKIFFLFDFPLWTLMEESETETILSIIVLTLLVASATDIKLHIPCFYSLYVDSHWPPISMSFFAQDAIEKEDFGLDLPSAQRHQQNHHAQHDAVLAFKDELDKLKQLEVRFVLCY